MKKFLSLVLVVATVSASSGWAQQVDGHNSPSNSTKAQKVKAATIGGAIGAFSGFFMAGPGMAGLSEIFDDIYHVYSPTKWKILVGTGLGAAAGAAVVLFLYDTQLNGAENRSAMTPECAEKISKDFSAVASPVGTEMAIKFVAPVSRTANIKQIIWTLRDNGIQVSDSAVQAIKTYLIDSKSCSVDLVK